MLILFDSLLQHAVTFLQPGISLLKTKSQKIVNYHIIIKISANMKKLFIQ
jgi:predicted choloylglycine hydrolase